MKKQRFLFALLMTLVMTAISPQKVWALGGSGTSGSPYTIANASDLVAFASKVNGGETGAYAKLTADITLTSAWTPIGNSSKIYTGTFDGQGHKISGLSLTATAANAGLFGYVNGATIKNFSLAGSISSNSDNVGSVVGYAKGSSTIQDIVSTVNITMTAAKSHLGGIAGNIENGTSVLGCTYSGTLNAGSSTDSNGGIVGFANANCSGTVQYCFFNGTIKTTGSGPQMGGILGYTNDTSNNFGGVQNCYSCGTLTYAGNDDYANAIVGRIRAKSHTTINNTFLDGTAARAANTNCDEKVDFTKNKAITISVKAGANGTVSQSYVNPTTSAATQLQVVATPNDHYHFGSWSDSQAQTHSVGLTANVSLTASFAIDQHTITVATNSSTMGTVSGGGTFDYNSTKTITATPQAHYHFVKWSDGDTNASRQITVSGDKTYTSTFAPNPYKITLKVNDSKMGTVSGGGTFDYGTKQTITATAQTNYHFVKWDDGSTNASRQITVSGDKTYTATFEAHTYGEWITDVAATCTTEGTKHRLCTHAGCNASEEGTITALGHDYADEYTIDQASDCGNDGIESRHCSRCESTTDERHITPTGNHTFADNDKNHTHCTVCGHTFIHYTTYGIKDINIDESLFPDLQARTFDRDTKCGTLEFNKALTAIGTRAFADVQNLENITLPQTIVSIGDRAFWMSTLRSIELPSSVTSIGEKAFFSCQSLTKIAGDHVTSVGGQAFFDCECLSSVSLPELTTLNGSPFLECPQLTTIYCPKLREGDNPFARCESISEITISCVLDIDQLQLAKLPTIIRAHIGETTGVEAHAPTCTAPGHHAYTCCDDPDCTLRDGHTAYIGSSGHQLDDNGECTVCHAAEVDVTGTYGTCTWTIYDDGSLIVKPTEGESGTLDSWIYSFDVPWYAHCDKIQHVYFRGEIIASTCEYMFLLCSNLRTISFGNFNTANVANMYGMFEGCSSLQQLDLSSFNTANVEDMYSMFEGCSSLQQLDLSSFNTEKVESMGCMFRSCSSLQQLILTNFNTAKVENMSFMFEGCTSLQLLDLSSFNTRKVGQFSFMFAYCKSLAALKLSNYFVTKGSDPLAKQAMFKDCGTYVDGAAWIYFVTNDDVWSQLSNCDSGLGSMKFSSAERSFEVLMNIILLGYAVDDLGHITRICYDLNDDGEYTVSDITKWFAIEAILSDVPEEEEW